VNIVIPTASGLSPPKHNFCHFLVADPSMNGTNAYIKVKPEAKKDTARQTSSKWLRDTDVRGYIGLLLDRREKRLQMDEDWVMHGLRDIHDRCMEIEPVYPSYKVFDEDGTEVPAEPLFCKFDASGATKALELIGKHLRMFSDKVDFAAMSVSMKLDLGGDKPVIEGDFKRVGNG